MREEQASGGAREGGQPPGVSGERNPRERPVLNANRGRSGQNRKMMSAENVYCSLRVLLSYTFALYERS
jgi:hypothetical protein